MFKIKGQAKSRDLDFINKDKNQWHFHNILTWEVYITAKRILTS